MKNSKYDDECIFEMKFENGGVRDGEIGMAVPTKTYICE